jgi:signal peptidase II
VPRAWYRAGLLAVAVIAADQVTKALVRAGIEPGDHHRLLPAIDLVNVRNRGIAFGLFTDSGALLTLVTIAALGLLVVYFVRHAERSFVWVPTGLLLGGALGNMLDRLVRGAVTDFIDVPLWPAFNVADTSITIGVLSLVYVIETGSRRHAPA